MNEFIKYSPSTGNFYPSNIAYDNLPADIVLLPYEDFISSSCRPAGSKMVVRDGRLHIEQDTAGFATKEQVWQNIKNERDRRIQEGGVLVGNKWFHTDTFSRAQQLGLSALGKNIPENTQWRTMDGSSVLMTSKLASSILAAAVTNDIAIFSAADNHRARMMESTDSANYDFSKGWPPSFLD